MIIVMYSTALHKSGVPPLPPHSNLDQRQQQKLETGLAHYDRGCEEVAHLNEVSVENTWGILFSHQEALL